MYRKVLCAAVVFASTLGLAQEPPGNDKAQRLLSSPHRQADFSPIAASGSSDVRWASGFLVSISPGEMKSPISLYDRDGKFLYETWPNVKDANKLYTQDATVNAQGTAIIAASASAKDGSIADFIAEVGPDGVRRMVQTTPFYPLKVCITDTGTVWVYGKELSLDRTKEARSEYPMLREYSFEKGELRTALNRNTVSPPPGVPVNGSKNDVYLQCNANKVVAVIGPTSELVEFNLATDTLARYSIGALPEGSYITGAAVTRAGEVYVSTLQPGNKARTDMMLLQAESPFKVHARSLAESSVGPFFLLLGNDGQDLVYAQGRQTPTVFWSKTAE